MLLLLLLRRGPQGPVYTFAPAGPGFHRTQLVTQRAGQSETHRAATAISARPMQAGSTRPTQTTTRRR